MKKNRNKEIIKKGEEYGKNLKSFYIGSFIFLIIIIIVVVYQIMK